MKNLEELILNNGTGIVRGNFRLLASMRAHFEMLRLKDDPENEQAKGFISQLVFSEDDKNKLKELTENYVIYLSFNDEMIGSYSFLPQSGIDDEVFSGKITLSTGEEIWLEGKLEDVNELYGTFTANRKVSDMGGITFDY